MPDKPLESIISAVRALGEGDVNDLRQSMRERGYDPELPVIQDENGVVLVGRRRLKAAQAEGIEAPIRTVTFGTGEEADVQRVRLALSSNISSQAVTVADRKHLAEHMYAKHGWPQMRIARALGVSQSTVCKYLGTLLQGNNVAGVDSLGRKRATGRPRRKHPPAAEQRAATAFLDEGKSHRKAAEEAGITMTVARMAVAREEGRREERNDPVIDRAILSKTAQEKLDAALRQHQKQLDATFEERVRSEIRRYLEETALPSLTEREKDAQRVIRARRGVMSAEDYRLILSCLHPDSRANVSLERLRKAFDAFRQHQLVLVAEKELETPNFEWPTTMEGLDALRRKVAEERRAAKGGAAAKP